METRTHVAALLILCACGAGACHGTARAPVLAESASTASPSVPEVFASGVISDAREQWRITFTPDGSTAYFAASDGFFPFTRQATIYRSRLADGRWTAPEVAPFSGRYSDIDPFITPDGSRLYFSSIRPVDGVARDDADIWMVELNGDTWSEPVHLGGGVNSTGDELYPSASADGALYFASGPLVPGGGLHYDIFVALPAGAGFGTREPLGSAVNTQPRDGGGLQDAWEFNPEISADGSTLVFTSLRPGGHGLGDLYVSRRKGDAWGPAENLGPLVNTAADEYHPTLSRDRRTLYFVRRLGQGDFYHVAASRIAALGAP